MPASGSPARFRTSTRTAYSPGVWNVCVGAASVLAGEPSPKSQRHVTGPPAFRTSAENVVVNGAGPWNRSAVGASEKCVASH